MQRIQQMHLFSIRNLAVQHGYLDNNFFKKVLGNWISSQKRMDLEPISPLNYKKHLNTKWNIDLSGYKNYQAISITHMTKLQ